MRKHRSVLRLDFYGPLLYWLIDEEIFSSVVSISGPHSSHEQHSQSNMVVVLGAAAPLGRRWLSVWPYRAVQHQATFHGDVRTRQRARQHFPRVPHLSASRLTREAAHSYRCDDQQRFLDDTRARCHSHMGEEDPGRSDLLLERRFNDERFSHQAGQFAIRHRCVSTAEEILSHDEVHLRSFHRQVRMVHACGRRCLHPNGQSREVPSIDRQS